MRFRGLSGRRSGAMALVLLLVMSLARPDAAAGQAPLDGVDAVVADLDRYWTDQFLGRNLPYSTPDLARSESPRERDCLGDEAATYCPGDATIYIDDETLGALLGGRAQIVGLTSLAFAWGAALADSTAGVADTRTGSDAAARDRFAACAAGVYIGQLWFDFQTREGDLIIAVEALGALPYPDDETTDGRVFSFMSGFVAGFGACLGDGGLASPE